MSCAIVDSTMTSATEDIVKLSNDLSTCVSDTSLTSLAPPPPPFIYCEASDYAHMSVAVAVALAGVTNRHGGPFGACIVKDDNIIAVGHNCVLTGSDPSQHAEVVCIRNACKTLGTHKLSNCVLYTTADPCPMCEGCIVMANIKKVYVGVSRLTVSKYGFDDGFFYEQMALPYDKRDVHTYTHVHDEAIIKELFESSASYKSKLGVAGGALDKMYREVFKEEDSSWTGRGEEVTPLDIEYMNAAIAVAKKGKIEGQSLERDPFGTVIVKDGVIIAAAYNTVLSERDPTCTSQINAIRTACRSLGTHILEGCSMYTTTEPNIMSLGAVYWSRLKALYIGVSLGTAARYGFTDGYMLRQHVYNYIEARDDSVQDTEPSSPGQCRTLMVDDVLRVIIMGDECERVFRIWDKSYRMTY